MIRKLIYKIRKRRFCKLNRWFCPDCIYHDFVFEGVIFRGNNCRYPKYRERSIVEKALAEKHQLLEETSILDTCPYYHHEPTGEPFCEMEDRRHGEWIDNANNDGIVDVLCVSEGYYTCNQCRTISGEQSNYCPNCGAKMDGERNE